MKDLSRLVVVDVEATTWEDERDATHPCYRGDSPRVSAVARGEESEIIEVGVCVLDLATLVPRAPFSVLIKPAGSYVSPFCERLTSISQTMLDVDGVPYLTAVERLTSALSLSKDVGWASWGDYDRVMFERAARRRMAGRDPAHAELAPPLYPWGATHLNARALFALATGAAAPPTLEAALALARLTFEGRPHRAAADAFNTARVLAWVLGLAHRAVEKFACADADEAPP